METPNPDGTPPVTRIGLAELRHVASGKVREIYAAPPALVLVATDRLSAFDVVFNEGIPGKGRVLTQLAAFWFGRTKHIIDNHLLSVAGEDFPMPVRQRPELAGRVTLCRAARVLPVECVVRGYLEGSAWKEYAASGTVCGLQLPAGLARRAALPDPIFTPATKAERGQHDENIDFAAMARLVGEALAERVRAVSIALYQYAHEYLDARGITLADTKFEFGLADGPEGAELLLVDEALTPDSSRFWVKGSNAGGAEPISFDKQYVRDYLEGLGWNKQPPPPPLPPEVIEHTAARYLEIYERITGTPLA